MSLTIENVQVHLIDKGSGTPTLFLHGNPDSADLWKRVIAPLSQHYRCLAPDLPGFGRSIAPAEFDCSLNSMAHFVDGLVIALGLTEPLNLVVHDLGGLYGLAWAVRYSTKVKRIAVMNTIFFSDYRWHFWARIWRMPLVGEFSMLTMNRWIFAWELRRGSRKLTAEHIYHTYAYLKPPIKRMVLRHYRAANPENFVGWEDQLLALTAHVPTLVLWGDQDPYISVKFADRFGAQQVQHFPANGHWLPVEAAGEVSEQLWKFFG